MELSRLQQRAKNEWWIAPHGKMRVPAIIFASESLIREMGEKVYEQVTNVAKLPGIVKASYAMPDAHSGAMASRSAVLRRSMPTKAA